MKPLDGTVEAYVQEIRANDVLLDLNHPLAGQTLHVFVKIADLQSPMQAEPIS
jgi:FKBP-type peptidyl-prolyl cis-trans isomerase 2